MKKLQVSSGKLNLYKEKISSLSNNEKVSIIGGNDLLSIINCNTNQKKCYIPTDDLGSRKSCEPSGEINCNSFTINP